MAKNSQKYKCWRLLGILDLLLKPKKKKIREDLDPKGSKSWQKKAIYCWHVKSVLNSLPIVYDTILFWKLCCRRLHCVMMSGGVTQAGGARLVLVEVRAGVAGGQEAGVVRDFLRLQGREKWRVGGRGFGWEQNSAVHAGRLWKILC